MYGIYKSDNFRRLDLGKFGSVGGFWKYMNYFKDYRHHGIEIFTMVGPWLSWLHLLTFVAAVRWGWPLWLLRITIKPHRNWPRLGMVKYEWLWFGFIHHVPAFVNRWMINYQNAQWEKELAAEAAYWEARETEEEKAYWAALADNEDDN